MQGHPDDWASVLQEFERLQKPKKIVHYIVIASICKDRLSRLISEWSAEGYSLYYGPFVNKGQEICQAMVKFE